MYNSQDPISTDLTWGSCTNFGLTVPDPNLSCGFYEVPMDYFDSTAGKARLALVKYQATVPNKKGTLFTNPGTITTCGSFGEMAYVKTLKAGLGGPGLNFCLYWGPRSVRTSKGSTISFHGIPAALALTHCECIPSHDSAKLLN